ncbi:MAG: hypothetical protein M1833_006016 [Piccolia ochrophora]|nr:MAG: hypothetical protein M1833_006016 [Piccolia ochrophora]
MRWIFVGIYAPELVVFTAWRQWCSANLLSKLVSDLDTTDQQGIGTVPDGQNGRRYPWTKTHSFFASTGGFAFDIGNETFAGDKEKYIFPSDCPQRITLTARGVALLAKCGHLPDISKEDILDKSKANGLAKALVILQASWMLLQILGRLIAKLPVTLLEVNTVAHVLCALLMYLMWWNKPLLPQEPITLSGEWVKPLVAFMYMSSEMSGGVAERPMASRSKSFNIFEYLHFVSWKPEIDGMAFSAPSATDQSTTNDATKCQMFSSVTYEDTEQHQTSTTIEHPLTPLPSLRLATQASLSELRSKALQRSKTSAFFERRPKLTGIVSEAPEDVDMGLYRRQIASTAIQRYKVIREQYVSKKHHSGQCLHFKSEELVVRRVRNWPGEDLLRNVNGLMVGMILWLANLAYAGVHAAAWNDHFPSSAEKWLWRSSAVYVGFAAGLWIILNGVAQAYKPLNTYWEGWMNGNGRWWDNILIGSAVTICTVAFVVARGYIVVEAFVSIRELPAEAYKTPDWTQVFPHF